MLADQIDPERTNIRTPNTIQRVFPYGADHYWVGAVLLTAHDLLKHTYLPNELDCEKALMLLFDAAQDIAGMYDLSENYQKAQEAAIASLDPKVRKDRSVVVPAIGNVAARCNEFIQRSDHALRELFSLVKLFYPDLGKGGWEGLRIKIENGPTDLDNFSQFLDQSLPFLQLVRNARNCVEHPRQEQRMVVTDFSVDQKNNLVPPTIEFVHQKTPLLKRPVSIFVEEVAENIVIIAELLVVFLCARHVRAMEGFPVHVVEIPEGRRRVKSVRYGYGANIGGEIVPMS